MKYINKILWGITIFFGVAAVVMFADTLYTREVKWPEASNKVEQARKEMDSIKPMAKLYETYGGKHDGSYYANFPVIVLQKGGKTKNIPIHFESNGTLSSSCPEQSKTGIYGKWTDALDGWQATFSVTSGSERGCYPIRFSNDVNNEAFDVLVVVK